MIGEPGRPARPVAVPIQRALGAPSLARSPAVAALAAAILLAFLGGIGIDRLAITPARLAWVFAGNTQAPGAVASLTYFRDRKQAVLAATGLPALPAGTLYEIWLIKNGTAAYARTSGLAGGKLVVTMTRDLTQYHSWRS